MTVSLVYDISFIIHKQNHTIPFSWVGIFCFFQEKIVCYYSAEDALN